MPDAGATVGFSGGIVPGLKGIATGRRDLTRDHERLEGLRGLETGFGPPVTFGPVRRLGARGAYILKADLRKQAWVPTGGWVGAA